MQTRIRLIFIPLLSSFFLSACASKSIAPAAPAAPIAPVQPPAVKGKAEFCYLAASPEEYKRLAVQAKKKKKVVVKGVTYPCVEDASPTEPECYISKSKKEYAKLSRQQDQHPQKPLEIKGKRYRCIQGIE